MRFEIGLGSVCCLLGQSLSAQTPERYVDQHKVTCPVHLQISRHCRWAMAPMARLCPRRGTERRYNLEALPLVLAFCSTMLAMTASDFSRVLLSVLCGVIGFVLSARWVRKHYLEDSRSDMEAVSSLRGVRPQTRGLHFLLAGGLVSSLCFRI